MSRSVLIGWELGAGNGHIQRILPLAEAFLADGWQVTAALRDTVRARSQLSAILPHPNFKLIQAPIFLHERRQASADSLALTLANMGFAETELLAPVVSAWRSLISSLAPAVIVSDIAPSLNIAAQGAAPLIVVGNGWTLPPVGAIEHDYFRGSQKPARSAGEAILAAARAVGFAGREFTDVLRGTQNFVCVPAELDPYRSKRARELYWPLEMATPAATRSSGRRRGIIYLPGDHSARQLVCDAAASAAIPFQAYFGDGQPQHPSITVRDRPIDFATELPASGIVIHHGGLGTAAWCLLNRVPQLICPPDFEKYLVARCVIEHGFGGAFPALTNETELAGAILSATGLVPDPPSYSQMITRSGDQTVAAILEGAAGLCRGNLTPRPPRGNLTSVSAKVFCTTAQEG